MVNAGFNKTLYMPLITMGGSDPMLTLKASPT